LVLAALDSPGSIYQSVMSSNAQLLSLTTLYQILGGCLESIESNFCATRLQEAMAGKLYPTDLSDQQWHILKPLIPTSKQAVVLA